MIRCKKTKFKTSGIKYIGSNWCFFAFRPKIFCQIWNGFLARNGFLPNLIFLQENFRPKLFFQMKLPYFLKYWKVWLAFNGWKLSGLFSKIMATVFYLHLNCGFFLNFWLFLPSRNMHLRDSVDMLMGYAQLRMTLWSRFFKMLKVCFKLNKVRLLWPDWSFPYDFLGCAKVGHVING